MPPFSVARAPAYTPGVEQTADLDDLPHPNPWALQAPEPTTLIALWPHDQPPAKTEVTAAMESRLGRPLQEVDRLDADDPQVLWTTVVGIPDHGEPVVIWCEPARPLAAQELDDPLASACRWVIGAETILDREDPFRSFTALLGLLAQAFADLPAVLDTNSGRWHPRAVLDEQFAPGALEPPEDVLWIIQSVSRKKEGSVWLHTRGLWRCGRPELEMLDVPPAHAAAADALLNTIAGRLLEEPVPAPGEPFPVAGDLAVTLQPWAAIAPSLAEGAPGALADRARNDDRDGGVRAVVCAATPANKSWGWPHEVVCGIERGEGFLFLSRRSTERKARQARATWPQLLRGFASLAASRWGRDGDPVRFALKAGLSRPDDPDGEREHLWFAVRRFDSDRAEAVLVNEPVLIKTLERGDVTWIGPEMISDWSVETPLGRFGPAEATAMGSALDKLSKQEEGTP